MVQAPQNPPRHPTPRVRRSPTYSKAFIMVKDRGTLYSAPMKLILTISSWLCLAIFSFTANSDFLYLLLINNKDCLDYFLSLTYGNNACDMTFFVFERRTNRQEKSFIPLGFDKAIVLNFIYLYLVIFSEFSTH